MILIAIGVVIGVIGVFVWVWWTDRKIVKAEDAYWGRTRD